MILLLSMKSRSMPRKKVTHDPTIGHILSRCNKPLGTSIEKFSPEAITARRLGLELATTQGLRNYLTELT